MKRIVRNHHELYEAMHKSIVYMREHANEPLTSSLIAEVVGMSTSRFEHVFAEWVGTTPKRFLMYLKKERVRELFKSTADVLKTTYASGLSGPNRLHQLLVTYEAVSASELKHGQIEIVYGIHSSPFGWGVLGLTKRGVCHLSFIEKKDEREAEKMIQGRWPQANLVRNDSKTEVVFKKIFTSQKTRRPFHLIVKGTNFQIKVWEALLSVPPGVRLRYADIASMVGAPKAVRAVGSACGANAIAYLIPCHRVLASSGKMGGYRWGVERKETMLAWEKLRQDI